MNARLDKEIAWTTIPMVRLLLPLVLGILLARIWPVGVLPAWTIAAWGLLALSVIFVGQRNPLALETRTFGGGVFILILILGYCLPAFYSAKSSLPIPEGDQPIAIAKITDIKAGEDRTRVFAKLIQIDDTAVSPMKVSLQLNGAVRARPDDLISWPYALRPVSLPDNPHGFDYRAYLADRRIHHQQYLREGSWKVHAQPSNSIQRMAFLARHHLIGTLKEYIPQKEEQAVAAALILGYKDELPDSVKTAYATSGATHILAVSGMHVGIVMLVFQWLLGRFRLQQKWWPVLRTSFLVAILWVFAFLTGAAPSVLRAATMFSLFLLSQHQQNDTNIYNTLAATAFILLIADPLMLFHVGFQLSFAAVIGIVYIHPKIFRTWYIKNKVGRYLWSLVCVSIAAQIGTLPISLYYFHQFPIYFWLSGMIVVPAAALILSVGILLLAVSWWAALAKLVGLLLQAILWVVNALMYQLSSLPEALLDGIWLELWEAVLLVGLFGLAVAARESRRLRWVSVAVVVLIAWQGIRFYQQVKQAGEYELCVYAARKESLIDARVGKHVYPFRSPGLTTESQNRYSQYHHWAAGAVLSPATILGQSSRPLPFSYARGIGVLGGRQFVILHADSPPFVLPETVDLDYIIVTDYVQKNAEKWIRATNPDQIVLAENLPWRYRNHWLEAGKTMNVPVHDVRVAGAAVIQWEE